MADILRDIGKIENGGEISRRDIQAAIAKTVELRALHAALMAGDSPANLRFPPSASPAARHARNLSAQDYPVFTPSYNDEPFSGYQQTLTESRNYPESNDETLLSDYKTTVSSSRKPNKAAPLDLHNCPAEERVKTNSLVNTVSFLNHPRSRRSSMEDMEVRSVSSCNKCRPAVISSESDCDTASKNVRKSNIVVPLTDPHLSLHPKQRSKNVVLSWLFPKLNKKKNKNESTQTTDVNEMSAVSVETLRVELTEANESKNAALSEVAEMKSSLGELKQKLEYLEAYCEELKKSLVLKNPQKLGKLIESERAMAEGFMQVVSEARLSVREFCKALIGRVEENDDVALVGNLNSMLQPYKLSVNSKYSKAVLCHVEAFVNQSLYQDFENCVFRKNGAPRILDPEQAREARFRSFVSLRSLSWEEVLKKGTKFYSDEFSKFCDQKMSGIITGLGCTRPWPEQLLQAFFVAAKCVWLVHLLAFSFRQPLGIVRVDENMVFESGYMEDIFTERQRSEGGGRVKIMVVPGFYVMDGVLKCKANSGIFHAAHHPLSDPYVKRAAAVFRDGVCWKMGSPLRNGRVDLSKGGKALIKIPNKYATAV